MKYLRGFMMAWGMFCWIPCPYKRWDEEARVAQVAMFPLVGTMIGLVVCLFWWLLDTFTGAGGFLVGTVLTALYFLLTGFIHLDGFMDCCDAVMPRHPDREQRLRILKDPHSGAFALISLVLMLLLFTAAFAQVAEDFDLSKAGAFIVILTVSRTASACSVILTRPMATSQYSGKQSSLRDAVPSILILLIVLVAIQLLTAPMTWQTLLFEPRTEIPAIVTLAAAALTGAADRKALGGMNGDIAGHLLVLGELAGMLSLAFLWM